MEGTFVGKSDNNLWHYNTKHDGLSRILQCWGVRRGNKGGTQHPKVLNLFQKMWSLGSWGKQ